MCTSSVPHEHGLACVQQGHVHVTRLPCQQPPFILWVHVPWLHGLWPMFILVFKGMDLKNKKNTYTVGCIVSLIFLHVSEDADPTVCIIKETNKESCRLPPEGDCLGVGVGVRVQGYSICKKTPSNLAIEVPSLLHYEILPGSEPIIQKWFHPQAWE